MGPHGWVARAIKKASSVRLTQGNGPWGMVQAAQGCAA